MAETKKPLKLAGSVLTHSCHVCAFFHSEEEKYQVLMPFIKEGFEHGDRAFHIVDPNQRARHMTRLEFEGINTVEAEARGQLEVLHWHETYIEDGRFDQHLMAETLKQVLAHNNASSGRMSAILPAWSGR